MLTLELPYPPSLSRYYRRVGAKTLVSAEGRAYRDAAVVLLRAAGGKAPAGQLSVEVDLYPPDRRRRDLDNCLKGLLDALTHAGVYEDDSLIARLLVQRRAVTAGGRCVVRLAAWRE